MIKRRPKGQTGAIPFFVFRLLCFFFSFLFETRSSPQFAGLRCSVPAPRPRPRHHWSRRRQREGRFFVQTRWGARHPQHVAHNSTGGLRRFWSMFFHFPGFHFGTGFLSLGHVSFSFFWGGVCPSKKTTKSGLKSGSHLRNLGLIPNIAAAHWAENIAQNRCRVFLKAQDMRSAEAAPCFLCALWTLQDEDAQEAEAR